MTTTDRCDRPADGTYNGRCERELPCEAHPPVEVVLARIADLKAQLDQGGAK